MLDKKIFYILKKLYMHIVSQIQWYVYFFSYIVVMLLYKKCFKIIDFNYLIILSLYIIGILLFYLYFKLLKNNLNRGIFIIALLSISIYVYIKNKQLINGFLILYIDYFEKISTQLLNGEATYFYEFLPYFAICIPIIVMLIYYFEEKELTIVNLFIICIPQLILYLTGFDEELKIALYYFLFASSILSVLIIYKHKIKSLDKKGYKISINLNSIKHQAVISSYFIVIIALIFMAVFGNKNIYQIIEYYNSLSKANSQSIIRTKYDLSQSGYSNNSVKLGGPVVLDDYVVFKVDAEDTYYLKGITKDYYDGQLWTSNNNYKNKSLLKDIKISDDYMQYFLGSKREENEKISKQKATIHSQNIITATLFVPMNTHNILSKNKNWFFNDALNFIQLSKTPSSYSYTAEFYKSNTGIEMYDYAYKNGYLAKYNTQELDTEFIEQYGKYLQVPDVISKRTYDLVYEITKDCSNTSEKIYKIKEYLINNYKYDLKTNILVDGQEFIDNFLFEEKKGYCTYFATAFTIMCRISKIPARYVEGFAMQDYKDDEGSYIVTNSMAHAWSEVLLLPKDDLWSIVECTPPYQHSININSDYYDEYQFYMNEEYEEEHADIDINLDNKEIDDNSVKRNFSILVLLKLFLIFILFLIIGLIVYRIIKYKKTIVSLIQSNKIVDLYIYTRKRLLKANLYSDYNTDDNTVLSNIDESVFKQKLSLLIEKTYSEYYGNKKIIDFDKIGFYNELEGYIKSKQKQIAYIINKYF